MSGHTPGPWRLADGWKTMIDSDGGIICRCDVKSMIDPPGVREAQNEANARLIAASPDLLEALKRYVEHDDTAYDPAETFWRQIKDEALAAIAKAEGR